MRRSALLTILIAGLVGCSDMSSNNDPNPPAHDIAIVQNAKTMGASAFSPATLTISLATQNKVTWYNGDFSSGTYGGNGTTHKVFSDDAVTFSSNNIGIRGVYVATLNTTGTFHYHCAIHPTMTGTLIVNP
ncbi:MAG: hypothetical protein ABI679_00765 [Gemmatimonadota bacterium]